MHVPRTRIVLASWKVPSFRWLVTVSGLIIGASASWLAVVLAATPHLRHAPPYVDPQRLVTVVVADDTRDLPGPALARWREMASPIRVAGFRSRSRVDVAAGGREVTVGAADVSIDLMNVLGIAPRLGRPFTIGDDVQGTGEPVLLGWRLARSLFGDVEAAVDARVVVDGEPRTVAGVMPPGFWFPTVGTELWAPMGVVPFVRTGNRVSIPYYTVLARLPADVPPEDAGRGLRDVVARASPRMRDREMLSVAPVADVWHRTERRAARLIGMLTLMLLLSALLTGVLSGAAWWTAMYPRWTVLHAVGARSAHTVAEWAAATTSVGLASILLWLVVDFLVSAAVDRATADRGARLATDPTEAPWVVAWIVLASSVTGGLAPALMHVTARHAWVGGVGTVPAGLRGWSQLPSSGQLALAIAGVITTVSVVGALNRFTYGTFGFLVNAQTVVVDIRLPPDDRADTTSRHERIAMLPHLLGEGVSPSPLVAVLDEPPYATPALRVEMSMAGADGPVREFVGLRLSAGEHLRALGIRPVSGESRVGARGFGIAVSRSLARWSGVEIGGRLSLADQLWEVDAIVPDERSASASAGSLVAYVPFEFAWRLPDRLRRDATRSVTAIWRGPFHELRQRFSAIEDLLGPGTKIVGHGTMAERVSELAPHLKLASQVGGGFTVLSLAIALLGLAGTWYRRIRSRRAELGMRLALGATHRHLLAQEVALATRLLVVASLAGALGLAGVWPHVSSQLPELVVPGWWTIAAVLCTVWAVALLLVGITTVVMTRGSLPRLLSEASVLERAR